MVLFNRKVKLSIGKPNNEVLVFTEKYQIEFDVTVDTTGTSKNSTIKIYNLSKTQRDYLDSIMIANNKDIINNNPIHKLWLYAGYYGTPTSKEPDAKQIFVGEFNTISHEKNFQTGDMVTTFFCNDCSVSLGNSYTSASFAPGTTQESIIRKHARDANLTVSSSSVFGDIKNFPNGYSYDGATKLGLDKITEATGLNYAIQDNQITTFKKGGTSNHIVVIDAEHGMIETPRRQEKNIGSDDEKKSCWEIKTLINGDIKAGCEIRINSILNKNVNGIYKVELVNHTGASMNGDFITRIEVKDKL